MAAGAKVAPPAPDPLPSLVDQARTYHRQLAAVEGMELPAFEAPRSLAALNQSLTQLLATGRAQVTRLEREQTAVAQAAEQTAAQIERLTTLGDQLEARIARTKTDLASTRRAVVDAQRRALAAREQFLAWQKVNADLREQIRLTRNRLFPRLHQAAQRGWILPPSAYRTLPVPQSPAVREATDPEHLVPQAFSRAGASVFELEGSRLNPGALPLASSFAMQRAAPDDIEANVRIKLHEFAALSYRAYSAATLRSTDTRAGESARAELEARAAKLAALEPAYTEITGQLARLQQQRAETRTTADTESRRLHDLRHRTLITWIEGAIYRCLDQQSELARTPPSPDPEAAALRALRATAATAARLGSEPSALMSKLPAELGAGGDPLTNVRQEVDALRTALGFTLDFDPNELPAELARYFAKGSP